MSERNSTCILRDIKAPESTLEVVLGSFTVGIFVALWVGSIASPAVLIWSVYRKFYYLAATILCIAISSYLPWEKGFLSRKLTDFVDWYHPRFYRSCRTIFANASHRRPNKTLYAVHPHGAFCLGWSTLFHSRFMEDVRFCFSPALFFSPVFRLWCRLTGKPGKADKASMVSCMKRGENLALPPGGFEEATLTCFDKDRVYIRKRAGFVKLCLQHGYSIVPVYCFGEKGTFWNVQGAWNLRLALNGLGIPTILIWGSTFLPFLPKRAHLLVVAGDPIECPHISSPSRKDVEVWHEKYIASLQTLFETFKEEAMYHKDDKLEVW